MRKYIAKKLKSKEGFTLAELLIVVAIIAILAMISIPIFTSKLDDAKLNTDKANVRNAKAAAIAEYMNGEKSGSETYYYNADSGAVVSANSGLKGYNQRPKTAGEADEDGSGTDNAGVAAKKGVVKVVINTNGTTGTGSSIKISWEAVPES